MNVNPNPEEEPEYVWFVLPPPETLNCRCVIITDRRKKSFEEQVKDMCDLVFGDTDPRMEQAIHV